MHRRSARAGGFTLVEILVVIVIIGVIAAGALLSLSSTGRDSGLEQERDRLAALIDYVRERGELQTLEYGIHCTPTGYRFLVYDPRQSAWVTDTLDDVLRRPRELPAGLLITLLIEGHEVVLEAPRNAQSPGPLRPQVLLLSSGELNSFALTLKRAGTRRNVTLRTSADGTGIEVGAIEEDS
jgi:general secretion pathway protein H